MTSNDDKYYFVGTEDFGILVNYKRNEFWTVTSKSITIRPCHLKRDYFETSKVIFKIAESEFITYLLLKHGVERPSWK